jgi:hypothetical protein
VNLTPEQEAIVRKAGKTLEEFAREVDAQPSPKQQRDDIGEAIVVTFQNDNQLGDLVMSLFLQVNDLATLVMEQQIELEALKNA